MSLHYLVQYLSELYEMTWRRFLKYFRAIVNQLSPPFPSLKSGPVQRGKHKLDYWWTMLFGDHFSKWFIIILKFQVRANPSKASHRSSGCRGGALLGVRTKCHGTKCHRTKCPSSKCHAENGQPDKMPPRDKQLQTKWHRLKIK